MAGQVGTAGGTAVNLLFRQELLEYFAHSFHLLVPCTFTLEFACCFGAAVIQCSLRSHFDAGMTTMRREEGSRSGGSGSCTTTQREECSADRCRGAYENTSLRAVN